MAEKLTLRLGGCPPSRCVAVAWLLFSSPSGLLSPSPSLRPFCKHPCPLTFFVFFSQPHKVGYLFPRDFLPLGPATLVEGRLNRSLEPLSSHSLVAVSFVILALRGPSPSLAPGLVVVELCFRWNVGSPCLSPLCRIRRCSCGVWVRLCCVPLLLCGCL